ncbi:hypothetical protein TL16_g03799 [Triparma laevis f. inornata]|uniref:Uncharacterized protein n=1 Tax=Triparma laevis f. inornata TaxID=1714386 RepID=A0A9W7E2U6_9STRA|nr:hypothetical protein TL16_g03799 [Triparma laevis f. inornata]
MESNLPNLPKLGGSFTKMSSRSSSPSSKSPSSKPQSPSTDTISPLLNSIKSLQWSTALSLLSLHPSSASLPDPSGYYPLHHSVFLRAPLELIERLVEVFKDAVEEADPGDGCLPVHLCCESLAGRGGKKEKGGEKLYRFGD